MLSRLEVKDTTYRVGDRLEATKTAGEIDMCSPGFEVEILCFKKMGGDWHIGVKCEKEMPDWHDLDGQVSHGHGLWLTRGTLVECFKRLPNVYQVNGTFIFKKRNLSGMKFRFLFKTDDGMLLAEMEEDVGGGGGDGLGKAGRCVLLPSGLAKHLPDRKKSK